MSILLLPPEILSEIISHVKTAQTLHHLSLTCHKFYDFIEQEGWRLFVLHRFPSIRTPPFWKDASHALTNLSRNWDRKSFLARPILPSKSIWALPEGDHREKWSKPRKQTMDYQPVIDSYEIQIGNNWASKREVLAWSAGAEVVMRITDKGNDAHERWLSSSLSERVRKFNHHHHEISWITHKETDQIDGRDDITVLKLWKSPTSFGELLDKNMPAQSQRVLVGRASGRLQLLHLTQGSGSVSQDFATNGHSIRGADFCHSNQSLLASCLGDRNIALFKIKNTIEPIESCDQIEIPVDKNNHCRTWCTRFLSENRLAVGRGISSDIIHVYELNSSGLVSNPLRIFKRGNRDRDSEPQMASSTSVYGLENLPPTGIGDDSACGNVFLSGGYDGYIRLHDMRSPEYHDAIFYDKFDDSAIFSLQIIGRERLVAGSGRHSLLRFFDLRMTGGRAYEYIDALPTYKRGQIINSTDQVSPNCDTYGTTRVNSVRASAKEWDVFANAQIPRRSTRDSPVYSLSSPSSSSLSLYVGTEGSVMQMDFIDVIDQHPDPTFVHGVQRTRFGDILVQKTWNPLRDGVNLSMLDCHPVRVLPRRVQRGIGSYKAEELNYDARWLKVKPWF